MAKPIALVILTLVLFSGIKSVSGNHVFLHDFGVVNHPSHADESNIGKSIPDFALPDTNDKQISLNDHQAKATVVVFMSTRCPIGNGYVPDINRLVDQFKDQSVQVVGINPCPADDIASIKKHHQEFELKFPVLVDAQQLAVDLFEAKRTPEFYVLDRRHVIRYRGRMDDRIGYDYKRAKSKRDDLIIALKEVLSGQSVSIPRTEPTGCLITQTRKQQRTTEVTYASDVAKIFQKRCAECHHPNTAAPFSLQDFDDARDWSEMIKEVVQQRRMPPWNADSRFGDFKNDLRMPKEEIDTLIQWVDSGTPEGDLSKVPKPHPYADGWTIEKPDLVFEIPKKFNVPASGAVEYQYFVTPTHFEKDVWVQASEARPDNRAAVHHIIVFVRKKGDSRRGGLPAVAGFAPGEEPMIFPAGTGFKIPAGAELVWQVHYTPTGKKEIDQSQVGLVLCKQKPEREVHAGGAMNLRFEIPAHAENHRVVSSKRFDQSVELLTLTPHMHLRGKDFRYTAIYPDGKRKILLNIPRYDFNWQHRYRFRQPILLPKGTVLECVAHFDNSDENPANPDPENPVRWGDQTWEEMMIGWYSFVLPKTKSKKSGVKP